MSAEAIRAGKREKYQALEDAQMNTHVVEFFLFASESGAAPHIGKSGTRVLHKYAIKPNPEVTFKRSEAATPEGFQKAHDVVIVGAFPEKLSGVIVGGPNNNQAVTKTYNSPRDFRADIEKADYFAIDGEKFEYRDGGHLDIDKLESIWKLKLVRLAKQ
jgi:hypothetical protein